MSEIKWIKITTDIFDDDKILLIESLPDADAIIIIWFKLLCLAGKQNNSGVFIMNDRIPYSESMLATIFRRKEATVKLALKTFKEFGMIEIIDDVITIPNWGKHQNLDQLEAKKEYMRNYMKDYRKKQALIAEQGYSLECKTNGKTNRKTNVRQADKIREEKNRKEGEEIGYSASAEPPSPTEIVNLFNSICTSYPRVNSISETRKKAIRARLRNYTADDFRKLFEKAEASAFLKGSNNRDWTANFDWLIKDGNMAKVLDGNYDDKKSSSGGSNDALEAFFAKRRGENND